MSTVDINAKRDLSIAGDVVGRDKITINLPPPLPPAEVNDRANLLILLRKVKTFWIEGVLEKSVHNAVLLELGKETTPEAVDHPWEMVLELPDQTNQILPSGTKIIDIFEKMNRAMLILGEPGSGKTITLLELARDLITRAEADPTQPIPVVFNLSSWTDKRQLLHDWLVFELSTKYQIPKRIGRAWLKDNRILPLLDGLDEVKAENRASCVEAINHFGETFGLPGRVVCSRQKEYTKLPVRLELNGAIYLQSLTLAQVSSYMEAGGKKMVALRSTLQKDEVLQELARSPLMLNVMSLAYQDVPIELISSHTHEGVEVCRKYLFDTYIDRMFKRKGKANPSYATEEIIGWLAWFAQNMRQQNQTVFLIEQLQPSWLNNQIWQRVYVVGSRLIQGLALGLAIAVLSQWPIYVSMGLIIEPLKTEEVSPDYLLIDRLALGIIIGFLLGLVDTLRFEQLGTRMQVRQNGKFLRTAYNMLGVAVVFGLLFLLLGYDWSAANHRLSQVKLVWSLVWGLILGLIFGFRGSKQTIVNDIQPVETLKFSLQRAVIGCLIGVLAGRMLQIIDFWGNLSIPLAPFHSIKDMVLLGIIGFVFGGIRTGVLEKKSFPNQGIQLSLRNAIFISPLLGLSLGLIANLLGVPEKDDLFLGFLLGMSATLWYGGLDIVQHYTLRFILWYKRYIPWNYARFLDYAASLIFLQKVGGGYIFIHRMLLEHFAAMPLQSENQKKTIR